MINAAFIWDDETAYFFEGSVFYRYNIRRDEVDPGYPRVTAEEWDGWPQHWDEIDSAVRWPGNKVYFFRGNEYILFDLDRDHVLDGYPQPIRSSWAGWPAHWTEVHAAVVWPNGRAYFFWNDEYIAYDVAQDRVLPGYPRPISEWRGWPSHWRGVDAAVVWPNGAAYFFSGDEYLKFDVQRDTVAPGYPQAIASAWRGLPSGGGEGEFGGGEGNFGGGEGNFGGGEGAF